MNLIIDIGNTVAKVALFDRTSMVEVVYDSNQSLDSLEAVCNKYDCLTIRRGQEACSTEPAHTRLSL